MHALLMERGRIIDRLIAIKARQGGGSAFRPAREAAMMRALAERHRGLLPLDTVEGIWRIIISTFTYVQAPLFACMSTCRAATRRCAIRRASISASPFPACRITSAGGVIDAVARGSGDLGMFARRRRRRRRAPGGCGLAPPAAPKIIARLPFVERPDHPAGMPVFVIARPLADGAARDVVIEAVSLDRWRGDYPAALRRPGRRDHRQCGRRHGPVVADRPTRRA